MMVDTIECGGKKKVLKKTKHRTLTLNRALFSYMLVFLIPTVVLALLVRFSMMKEVFRREEAAIRNELAYMCATLDRQIGNFSDIANLIFFDEEILQYVNDGNDLPSNYKKFTDLQKSLKKMMASNTMIDELVLYIPGTEWFVSTNSSYSLKSLSQVLSIEELRGEEKLYNYLNTCEEYRILHAFRSSNREMLTMYVYTLKSGSTVHRPVLLFSTQASDYHAALKQAIGERIGAAFVTDTQGNVISYYCNDPNRSYLSYAEMLSDEKDGNNPLLFVHTVSSDGNRFYDVIIDERSIDSNNSYFNYMWFGLVAIVLLFGTNVALLVGYRSYEPIRQLRSRASTLFSEKAGDNDDYQFLVETLDYMDSRHEALQNSLNSSSHYLFFRLLKGTLDSAEELQSLSELLGIPLDQAAFRVLLLQTRAGKSAHAAEAQLRAGLPPSSNVLLLREEGETVAILVYDLREGEPLQLPHISCPFHSGSLQQDLRKIPLSYAEAVVGTEGDPAYIHACEKLHAAILRRETAGVSALLGELSAMVAGAGLADVRLCSVRFLLMLRQAARENNTQSRLAALPDPYTVLKYGYREEYLAFFDYYNAEFVKGLILPDAIYGESLNSRMTRYLQEHYSDVNFSLQQMADDFKLTPLALSRQFLELNGQTPSDYMAHYRVETAKLLLTTTNLSVNQIALEVGYYNVNSFIRRFGQMVGVTPGKYRQQSGKRIPER